MKVKVLQPFYDKKEKKIRNKGEVFICNKDRHEEIVKTLKKFSEKPFLEEVEDKK